MVSAGRGKRERTLSGRRSIAGIGLSAGWRAPLFADGARHRGLDVLEALPEPHWFVRVPRSGIANFRSTRPFPVGFAGVPVVRRIDWPPLLARDAAGFVAVNISMAIIAWPGAGSHAMDCRLGRRGGRVKRRR